MHRFNCCIWIHVVYAYCKKCVYICNCIYKYNIAQSTILQMRTRFDTGVYTIISTPVSMTLNCLGILYASS